MPEQFDCPSCGAPLEYDGSGNASMRCPFCNNAVVAPEALRTVRPTVPPVVPPSTGPGAFVNGPNPAVTLTVEVHPTNRPAFTAQVPCIAIAGSSVHKYQPGQLITWPTIPTTYHGLPVYTPECKPSGFALC
jgi:LSD1 subclass zinc finger protein